MSEINAWSAIAANNNASPPDGAPENTMTLGQVNDWGREVMRAVKAWQADTDGSLASTNVGNAYSVTLARNVTPYDGLAIRFKAAAANTAAVTLNVNGVAKSVKALDGTDIRAGEWQPDRLVYLTYVDALGVWVSHAMRPPVLTTAGDMLTRDGSGEIRLPIGSTGAVLTTTDGINPSWAKVAGENIALTGETRGDMIARGSSAWQRLPVGTAGQVLASDGTDVVYADRPGVVDLGSLTLSGLSSYEWTSIPSDVKVIHIFIEQASKTGSAETFQMLLGTSVTYVATGYGGLTTWNTVGATAWTTSVPLIGTAYAAARAADLHITLVPSGPTDFGISIQGTSFPSAGAAADQLIWGTGHSALVAPLTRIKIQCSGSETFDGVGRARAWGIR